MAYFPTSSYSIYAQTASLNLITQVTQSFYEWSSSYASASLSSSYSLTSSYALNALTTHVEKGVISGSDFSGDPKVYTITYSQAFNSNIYVVSVVGTNARVWSVISPSTTGSIISSNSNQIIDGYVYYRMEEI